MLPGSSTCSPRRTRPRTAPQGGLGIGLTLVRRLVELHGGSVSAASAGPGRGSEFVVRLPWRRPRPRTGAPGRLAGRRTPRADRDRGGCSSWTTNADAARSLARLLKSWGHEVQVAHDGPAALEAARPTGPDVVLLDIGLPGMDGYEVARRLEGQRRGGPRIVALTGYGQEEDRRRSQEAGFDHHLVKPVDPEELRKTLGE